MGASRRDPSTYAGKFEILVEPVTSEAKRTDASVLASGAKKTDESLTELDYPTQLRILTSPAMMKSIAEKLHQKAPKLDPAAIAQELGKSLVVNRVQQGTSRFDFTKIIEVTYQGTNPKWVQLVLDTTADRFVEYSQQERKKNLDFGILFIDRQLQRLKKQINTLQDRQESLQKNNDLIDPQAKGAELSTNYSQIQQKQKDLTAQLRDLQQMATHLEKTLGFDAKQAVIAVLLSQDPERQDLLVQLQKLDGEIALKSGFYQASSPMFQDLIELRDNINQLLDRRTRAILRDNKIEREPSAAILTFQDTIRQKSIQELVATQNQIDSVQNQLAELNQLARQVGDSFQKMPSLIKRYQELDRQLALNISLVDQLSAQRESLLVEKAQNKTPWQIISPPSLPRDAQGRAIAFPPNPKKKAIVGAGGGLVLGLLLAYIIERLQNKIFSTADLELHSTVPVLAKISGSSHSPIKESPIENDRVEDDRVEDSQTDERSPDASKPLLERVEAIAPFLTELYLDLHFRQQKPPIRTLMLVSLDSEPDRSAIAASLALTAASTHQQVLLVDANRDRPEIHAYFDLSPVPGLLDILPYPAQTLATIQKTATEPYLCILPLGSSENLSASYVSARWPELKDIFVEHYDLTIVNGPIFVNSIEVNLLAEQVDGILMIIRRDRVSLSRLKTVMRQIQTYKFPLIGLIELS
jgi:uncharacterized protein involved in exopolysaccharide biosynthesis/Mrp family chromosome partitioning ATPase